MKVQKVIDLINAEADELLDTDEDNIPYVNHALDVLAYFLAGIGDPEVIKTASIKDKTNVPNDFVDFIPKNGYPLYLENGKIRSMTGNTVNGVKYRIMFPKVSDLTDDMPCRDMYVNAIVLTASYLIKKKTYIPVEYCTQDKEFVMQVMQMIQSVRGGQNG